MRLPWRRTPQPMTCEEVAAVLQTYLDDESDPISARRVAHHLEDCVRCGMEASTYRRIKDSIRRGEPDLDPDSVARLRAFGEQLAAGQIIIDTDPSVS